MSDSISASAVVEAAPEKVWALVADVTRMGEWSPECAECSWVDGATGPEVGARFRGRNKRGPLARWSTTCTVTACEPGRSFAFSVGDPDSPETLWRYSFVPATGGTMVTETCEIVRRGNVAYRVVTALALGVLDREADLQRNIERTLQRLQVAGRAGALAD